jgi:hypothetical protein
MISISSSFIADIVFVDPTYVYIALAVMVGSVILLWLAVRSSGEYSVEKTEEESEDFAGEIRDSHGPVTTWLWVVYVGLIVWAIAYLIQHSAEFPSLI